MPTLTIPATYANGNVLTATDLDNIRNAVTTFVNTTKLDSANINSDSVGQGMSSTGANAIALSMTSSGADGIATTMSSAGANGIRQTMTKVSTASAANLGNIALSISTGTFTTSAGSFVAVTTSAGATVSATLTTSGRPVQLCLEPDTTGNPAYVGANATFGTVSSGTTVAAALNFQYQWMRGATSLGIGTINLSHTGTSFSGTRSIVTIPTNSISQKDYVSAGTSVYTLQVISPVQQVGGATVSAATTTVANCQISVNEMT